MSGRTKRAMNIYISQDTAERLKQYAWENRVTVSQAITNWIWNEAKVKETRSPGQQAMRSGG